MNAFPCGHTDPGTAAMRGGPQSQPVSTAYLATGSNADVCGTCGCPRVIPDGSVWITHMGKAMAKSEARKRGFLVLLAIPILASWIVAVILIAALAILL